MQPSWRRATLTHPLKMLFSASRIAWTSTIPRTVLRRIVRTAWAQVPPGEPIACRSSPVASRMLSLTSTGIGSSLTSSSWIWIEPMMLCSIRTRARTLVSSRLGSAGRLGSQSQSIPHPGTSVQWRITTSAGQSEPLSLPSPPALDLHGPSGDDDTIEREAAAHVERDGERIRHVGLPVDHPQHRAARDRRRGAAGPGPCPAICSNGST